MYIEWRNMVNKVIFLDYDGVLNNPSFILKSLRTGSRPMDCLDPQRINLIKWLCSITGAKIVLTSTWRDDKQTRKYLIQKWGLPIIGATPHKQDDRGKEINEWIRNKRFLGDFIIIDDEYCDYSKSQLDRLVFTGEGLGFTPKHLSFALSFFKFPVIANEEFITAILEAIESDLLRVMYNINQEDYDKENPFRNTGNVEGFKTDVFEVHAYDWGGWDINDENSSIQSPNFKWKDLEITWYKYCGRGMSTNRPVTHYELGVMLNECLKSLRNYEREHDDFEK